MQTKLLKIQPRLILDLESPTETNGTLGFPIRASEPQMLTKVKLSSQFHNFMQLWTSNLRFNSEFDSVTSHRPVSTF